MEQSKVQENIKRKYKLYNGQRITVEALIKLAEVENIELQDLLFVLGCYKNAKYKDENSWTTIGKKKNYNKRDIINFIKIDLKYLPQYGSRMYSKLEIDDICQKYDIFYKNIDNIAQKLINQNKVRLCSDGRVVIVNE